jgi:hypothetical protein
MTDDAAGADETEHESGDEAGRESFPASDPPSSWAGPPGSDALGDASPTHRPKDDSDMGEDAPSGDETADDDGPNPEIPPAFDAKAR